MENIIELVRDVLHLSIKRLNRKLDYTRSIPFLIKKSYDIQLFKIEDIECAVLTTEEGDIKSIKKHLSMFEESLQLPIVLNVLNITNSVQRYLIENKIPFISEESVYLPQLLVYFKNISKEKKLKRKNKKLSKLAQMIIIYQLLKNVYELDINECAKKFNVTKMSAGRALNELLELNFLDIDSFGRKKIYSLSRNNIELEDLLSTFRNPKIEDVYIESKDLKYFDALTISSYMALSHYTNITNAEKIYAIDKEIFNKYINKHNQIQIYDSYYDNNMIKIELWRYPPDLIQNNYVDPLSLYILLKEDKETEDTRLIDALEELYRKIEGIVY